MLLPEPNGCSEVGKKGDRESLPTRGNQQAGIKGRVSRSGVETKKRLSRGGSHTAL